MGPYGHADDIFPTVMKLAGAPPPPPGLIIDGTDLGPVLFQGATKAHDCITYYNYPHAATAADVINLSAMRCGDFKVYWWVPGSGAQPAGKPLVFDLVKHPSEDQPLSASDPDYVAAVKTAEAARVTHLKTIEIVPDQMARGNDPHLAICGAPDSQAKYPQWPNCSLTPQFWQAPICG
eukprot:COSAG01_NODE_28440_length_661_cov_0.807829_1_plen_177_part_10